MLEKENLQEVIGGTSLSAAMLSALIRAFNWALDLGRSIGSAIKRKKTNTTC